MSRPAASRWGVLGFDADPTPGSADETAGLVSVLAARGADWLDTADAMRGLGCSGLQGLYAAAYRDKLGQLPSRLSGMGDLAGGAADRLRSWGMLMEQWQVQADGVLAQAEDVVDMVAKRRSVLSLANEAASRSRQRYEDVLADGAASVQDRRDAAWRASDAVC